MNMLRRLFVIVSLVAAISVTTPPAAQASACANGGYVTSFCVSGYGWFVHTITIAIKDPYAYDNYWTHFHVNVHCRSGYPADVAEWSSAGIWLLPNHSNSHTWTIDSDAWGTAGAACDANNPCTLCVPGPNPAQLCAYGINNSVPPWKQVPDVACISYHG